MKKDPQEACSQVTAPPLSRKKKKIRRWKKSIQLEMTKADLGLKTPVGHSLKILDSNTTLKRYHYFEIC